MTLQETTERKRRVIFEVSFDLPNKVEAHGAAQFVLNIVRSGLPDDVRDSVEVKRARARA